DRTGRSCHGVERSRSADSHAQQRGRSHSLRHQHAGYGRAGICARGGETGERERRSDRDDHDRGQRIARGAGAFGRGSRIHSQAVHSGSGERARVAGAGEKTMSTDTSFITRSREENWHPVLELAVEEVFEIMVGCRVTPMTESEPAPNAEFTAMIGLAGALCGILTV